MKGVVFVYVVIGSITTATRLARLLERTAGVPASVVHTPAAIQTGGCSYSVRITDRAVETVKAVVDEYGINIKGIYELSGGEREYRDIS